MKKQFESKFIPNREEIEKQRKEILIDINKSNNEIKKNKKSNLIIFGLTIIVIIIFIKIVFGTIEIYNPLGYPTTKVRFYEVTVNNKTTSVGYNLVHKIPIIPFLVNFNSKYFGSNTIRGDEDHSYFEEDGSKKYIIDINSYSCYSGGHQIECKYNDQITKKNNDTKYTNLKIVRTNNPYEEVYNGKFKQDITEYVKKKGIYYVGITAKYSLVETEVYFYFKR